MELTQTNTQTITTIGSPVVFNNIVVPASKCILYNSNNGIITLKGIGGNGCYARFKITYSGNISSNTEDSDATLIASVNGNTIATTTMNAKSTASGDVYTVSRTFYVLVPKGTSSTLSIQSATSVSQTVTNSILVVDRVS